MINSEASDKDIARFLRDSSNKKALVDQMYEYFQAMQNYGMGDRVLDVEEKTHTKDELMNFTLRKFLHEFPMEQYSHPSNLKEVFAETGSKRRFLSSFWNDYFKEEENKEEYDPMEDLDFDF